MIVDSSTKQLSCSMLVPSIIAVMGKSKYNVTLTYFNLVNKDKFQGKVDNCFAINVGRLSVYLENICEYVDAR